MTDRIAKETIYKLYPAIAQSLRGLGEAAAKSGLEGSLIELVKLRASQINGCAYCLHIHSVDARKLGERQERLDLLPAWREAPCFSKREQAALAWTEALTTISHAAVSDELYATVSAQFSEAELINLTAAVVAINGWNRIAVPFQFVPPVEPAPGAGRAR